MLVSLTVGKVDAGVTVLLTPDKRLIEFPSILLPPDISSGSIVDIAVSQNLEKEAKAEQDFRALQERIFSSFGAAEPSIPVLRCRNATQTSVVLEWDPVQLATADLISLSLYRNGQKAGNIPRPLQMHSTKISGLAVDTKYVFHLVLRTTAGTFTSEKVEVATHKMTDLSGITITTGILPAATKESLAQTVERIGAKLADSVRIDTTHFVTTEGRGQAWEKAVENNIPVVRPEWVDACEKNGRILGVTKFYLDAMRPGPPVEESPQQSQPPTAPPVQKELPEAPQPTDNEANDAEEDSASKDYAPLGTDKKEGEAADESSSEDDDEDTGAPEQKSRNAALEEEQKVRTEDMAEQKLALRPSDAEGSKTNGDGANEDKSEEGDETKDDVEEEKKKNAAQTPDGASFTDVQL